MKYIKTILKTLLIYSIIFSLLGIYLINAACSIQDISMFLKGKEVVSDHHHHHHYSSEKTENSSENCCDEISNTFFSLNLEINSLENYYFFRLFVEYVFCFYPTHVLFLEIKEKIRWKPPPQLESNIDVRIFISSFQI